MEPRIDYGTASPKGLAAMLGMERHVHASGLDPKLIELVKLRASLINGCAYCVDMHTKVARSLGETEQRLYAVSVWEETLFFPTGSARRLRGPRRSPWSTWTMCLTKCTRWRGRSSASRNWSISR